MRRKRILIVFYLLTLAGCASSVRPPPVAGPEISLRTDKGMAAVNRQAPAAKDGRNTPAADPETAAADTNSENDVYFSSGDARINERGQEILRRHAARLKGNPQEIVTLVGYTDPLGSRSYNLAIAEERMDSVVELLRSLGVPRGQIRRISAGQAKAMTANCDTTACRQLMRRVELVYER